MNDISSSTGPNWKEVFTNVPQMLTAKIAQMVPLCWTKWLPELKIEKKNKISPTEQQTQIQNIFTKMFPVMACIKIAQMVPFLNKMATPPPPPPKKKK